MSLTFVCAQAISARASSSAIEFRKTDLFTGMHSLDAMRSLLQSHKAEMSQSSGSAFMPTVRQARRTG